MTIVGDWMSIQNTPESLQIFLVVTFGLCIGSFLNVVIYRLPRNKSVVAPSSRCGFCRSAIDWFMNIPVIGFLCNGGRCRACGYAYSIRYPIVELLNAFIFFVLWSIYGWQPELVIYCALASTLIAISFIDLEFKIIPDVLSKGGWILAVILSLIGAFRFPLSFSESVIGSLFGYFSFWSLSRLYAFFAAEEGLGGGDVKLMGLIGAVLGFRGVLTTILLGSLLGSIVGVVTIMVLHKTKKFPIPFGPFLAVGAFASMFHLDSLWWP